MGTLGRGLYESSTIIEKAVVDCLSTSPSNHLYALKEVSPGLTCLLYHNTLYASAFMCLGVDLNLCDVSL